LLVGVHDLGFFNAFFALDSSFLMLSTVGSSSGMVAAEFLDRLADFGSHFTAGAVGFVFAGDFFTAEFVLGLCGSEEVGASSLLPV